MVDEESEYNYGIPILSGCYSFPESQLKKCLNHIRRAHFGHVITIAGHENICGVGKSTFAAKLAMSSDTRKHFQFGIVWVHVGQRNSYDEHTSALQQVAYQLVDNATRFMSPEDINRDELVSKISSSDSNACIEDCIDVMQTVFRTLITTCGTSEIPKCLIVFDDVYDDQLVRCLQSLDVVMVVTTRFPEIFSSEFPGTIYFMETVSVEQKTKVLCNAAGLYQQATSLPSLALDVLSTCQTLFEVDLCSHLLSTQLRREDDLEKLLRRRRQEASHSEYYAAWIIKEVDALWHNLNLIHHIGTLTAMSMCYEQLDSATQQQYLMLALCPSGVTLSRHFLMMLLNLSGSTEFNAFAGSLVAKHMLTCVQTGGPESPKLYQLHYLHWVFLKLVLLRTERKRAPSFFCFSFGQTAPRQLLDGSRDVFEALEDAAERIVVYITSPEVVTGTRLVEMLPLWRTLVLCGELRILIDFEGPLVCFHRIAQELVSTDFTGVIADSRLVVDYVKAASGIIEQFQDMSSGTTSVLSMKDWYNFCLNTVESQESLISGLIKSPERDALLSDISQQRAAIMNKMGAIFCKEGQLKFALDYHLRALNELQKKGRPTITHVHKQISNTFAYIANIYIARKLYDEAAHIIQSVIKFNEGLHGPTYKENAGAWYQLGDMLMLLGRYSDSLYAYDAAIHIYTVTVGSLHVDAIVAEAAKSVAVIKSGDPDNGVYALRRCIQLLKQQDYAMDDPKFLCFVEYLPEEERVHFAPFRRGQGGVGGGNRAFNSFMFCGLISCVNEVDGEDHDDSDEG